MSKNSDLRASNKQSNAATSEHYKTSSVVSKDGTRIGYRQLGYGPGVVVVHGSNVSSQNFMQLAEGLADVFTVYVPDRRGRGLSGPFGKDYSIQREVEDLEALLTQTGARNVFGISAGGLITLQAALTLPAIEKAAFYEPALLLSGSERTAWLARFDQDGSRKGGRSAYHLYERIAAGASCIQRHASVAARVSDEDGDGKRR
ncbi:alpha/beta hydrolase [Paenibacillus filicis]|uniref:Alpha/beta hydrolase n=1 Tax=Paenibacillus gyeongsangnamensis TaxID=3388067 RepID=A0ABT4QEG9_9BACL|nr:alpha/beta hydrolase [Paenibacillus filicis]MCZ8515273.1 alpha/beta hydrolase [Paenibacillus filicis]